mmetsp:Transcript_23484/g.30695  ORF Transcript_23484/g.30695 Transcript_23484/m.30695 type:complete len:861 (-) Transcript_23484:288-2870(-)
MSSFQLDHKQIITEDQRQIILASLAEIHPPKHYDKVYKDECMFSFDTPFSSDGLFVNLKSLQGFGIRFVGQDARKSPKPTLYLLQKFQKVARVVEEGKEAKEEAPTSLALGTEGGFLTDDQKWETQKTHQLVIASPDGARGEALNYPNDDLPEGLNLVIQAIIEHQGAAAQADVNTWEAGEEVRESKYAESLIQLDNGKRISPDPSTWKCEESGMTENLWLNLSTGYIGSGRQNFDGTGGTGAALKHYNETGGLYPLAVKLGTITASGADVYSYAPDEDDMVKDPKLAEHMAHWGINIMQLEKTDKTMAELEVELNKTYDFSKITESGKNLEPIRGPGYTGLKNLGNSCYCNSVMQCLLSLPEMKLRYEGNAQVFFQTAPENPAEDFLSQMAKLAQGVHSGEYCGVPEEEEEHKKVNEVIVAPRMFKSLVGRGHVEFSSGRQQDAAEYLQHLLEFMTRAEFGNAGRMGGEGNVKASASWFEFGFEDRLQCPETASVKYVERKDNMLGLMIPMEHVANQAEVSTYKEAVAKREAEAPEGTKPVLDDLEEVKPLVPLAACIESLSAPEQVDGFYSPLASKSVVASKVTRFKTFPRYLLVQLKRYYVDESWMPQKLDVLVDVPETLSLEHLRSTGLQENETAMPEDATMEDAGPAAPEAVEPNPEIVAQLVSMGFSENGCKRACIATNNANADVAMNWVLEHMGDPDFNDPPAPPQSSSSGSTEFAANPELVMTLSSMGFTEQQVTAALKATDNNGERAADWLFSHMDNLDAAIADLEGNSGTGSSGAKSAGELEDGVGNYTLHGFISHVGKNTGSGHYVCHIRKEDRWVIFDDQKVAVSQDPPLKLGYIYIFRRDDAPAVDS